MLTCVLLRRMSVAFLFAFAYFTVCWYFVEQKLRLTHCIYTIWKLTLWTTLQTTLNESICLRPYVMHLCASHALKHLDPMSSSRTDSDITCRKESAIEFWFLLLSLYSYCLQVPTFIFSFRNMRPHTEDQRTAAGYDDDFHSVDTFQELPAVREIKTKQHSKLETTLIRWQVGAEVIVAGVNWVEVVIVTARFSGGQCEGRTNYSTQNNCTAVAAHERYDLCYWTVTCRFHSGLSINDCIDCILLLHVIQS